MWSSQQVFSQTSQRLLWLECSHLCSLCFGRVCCSRGVFYLSASGGSARWASSELIVEHWQYSHVSCLQTHIPVITLYSLRCVSRLFVAMLSSFVTSISCLSVTIFAFSYCVYVPSLTFLVSPFPSAHQPHAPFFLSSILFSSNLPLYLMKGKYRLTECRLTGRCTQLLVGLCKKMIRRAWREV